MQGRFGLVIGAAALFSISFAGVAQAISVEFDEFGALDAKEFGGTGIPQDNVAISRLENEARGDITLGMSAHGRYANPDVTDDGAGTFTALAGSNFGIPSDPDDTTRSSLRGATWNFDFYAAVTDGTFPPPNENADGSNIDEYNLGNYTFELLYDFDPAVDTAESDLGVWNLNEAINAAEDLSDSDLNELPSSQNLLFSFLNDSSVPGVTPPSGSFDPNALGEYSFALTATNPETDEEVARSAINVNVVPTPGAAGAGLAMLGLTGVGGLLRRRRGAAAEA
jgi:hypothetical protein